MSQFIFDQPSGATHVINNLSVPGSLTIGGAVFPITKGKAWFVDGDNGANSQDGTSWSSAVASITQGISLASAGDTVFVATRKIAAGGTDPVNYAETFIIPASKPGLRLIGVNNGVKQGAMPQVKIGAGSTAMLTLRAPGCYISGLTFNGISSTGGGILIEDDASTKTAMGTNIDGCFFKNCVGSGATDASTGGAIYSVTGGFWNSIIQNCEFYDNIGGIVCHTASNTQIDDLTIRDCTFNQSAAGKRDVDILLDAAANRGLLIDHCNFGVIPSGATSNLYLKLNAGTTGTIQNCTFACSGKTFNGTGGTVPATVFLSNNWQEIAQGSAAGGYIGRT